MEHLTASTLTSLATTAGWVGAGGTVVAYSLLTAGRIRPDSRTFQGLNAAGAGLLALSAASHQSWPSTTVNLTWMLIGLSALLGVGRLVRPRHRTAASSTERSPSPVDGPYVCADSAAQGCTSAPTRRARGARSRRLGGPAQPTCQWRRTSSARASSSFVTSSIGDSSS